MSTVTTTIRATPEEAFAVLADAGSYAYWVVGSKVIRSSDPTWPAPGSAFHHTVGVGPISIRDLSRVLECDPPARLVLEVRSGPLGHAVVTFDVTPDGAGTRIRMTEKPVRGPFRWLPALLVDPMTSLRNTETLRRLKRLVETRRPAR